MTEHRAARFIQNRNDDGRIRCVYHPKLEIELNDLERDYSKMVK